MLTVKSNSWFLKLVVVLLVVAGCSTEPTASVDEVSSIEYKSIGMIGTITLSVSASQIHYERFANDTCCNRDTTVSDSTFLSILSKTFNLNDALELWDKVDNDDLALDSPLESVKIRYRKRGEGDFHDKVVKFTHPPHYELNSLVIQMREKMSTY